MAKKSSTHCTWEDDAGTYVTDCKKYFRMNDDSADDPEWIRFCCFCGRRVEFMQDAEVAP